MHIFELDKNFSLKRKIFSKKADIKDNIWVLSDVKIYTLKDGIMEKEIIDNLLLNSIYNYEKINNLFNNSDTFSFLEISINFNKMLEKGYNKEFLQQSLHTMMTLPFYLFVMTAIATILTLHTMKNSENFRFFIIGLILIVIIY